MENTSPPQKNKVFYGYIVVLSSFLVLLLTFGAVYSFGVFLKPMVVDLGWTVTMTSGAYSLGIFIRGLLGIVAGRFTDKFGPRIVVTTAGLFLGLGYLLMSQVKAGWELYLFYGVIIAIGQSGTFIPVATTISRWFVKRRGVMTGIAITGSSIGTMIMAPVAGWLISSYGWRTSYVIMGAMLLILIILIAQFLKRDPGQMGLLPYGEQELKQEKNTNLETGGFSFGEAIHTRQIWIVCIVFFFYMFCLQTILVHIVNHATGLGISAADAANILAIIAGMSIVGKIALGSIADRIGNKLALILSFALFSVGLLLLIPAKTLWMLYLFAALFGLGWGGGPLITPLLSELFGQGALGAIMGVVGFSTDFGGTFGPVSAGGIFDLVGGYQPAFLTCIALSTVSIVLLLLLRPSRKQIFTDTSG